MVWRKVLAETDVLLWWGHKAHQRGEWWNCRSGAEGVFWMEWVWSPYIPHIMQRFSSVSWDDVWAWWMAWSWRKGKALGYRALSSHHWRNRCLYELEHEEMYGERFDVPEPDKVVFISWFEGGEVFRSGMTFSRGRGKVFYFRPGHETYPTYHNQGCPTRHSQRSSLGKIRRNTMPMKESPKMADPWSQLKTKLSETAGIHWNFMSGKRLLNKVALITGSNSGIGAELRRLMLPKGRLSLSPGSINQRWKCVSGILKKGGRAFFQKLDVTNSAESDAACMKAVEKFGGLDILVNSAGVYPRVKFDDTTPEIWDSIFNVECERSISLFQSGHSSNERRGKGCIINIGSIHAFATGSTDLFAYGCSKGALYSLTMTMAKHLIRDRIRVNWVTVGWVLNREWSPSPWKRSRMDAVKREEKGKEPSIESF